MDVGRVGRCITRSTSGRSIRQLLPKMLHSLLAALVFIRRRTAEASCCGISWFRYSVIVFVDRRFKSLYHTTPSTTMRCIHDWHGTDV